MEDLDLAESNIIGGTLVEEGKYGFLAAIHRNVDELICGGSLIAPNVVLTTDSCIRKAKFVVLGCSKLDAAEGCEQINVVDTKSFADLDVPDNSISFQGESYSDFDFPSSRDLFNEVDLGIIILERSSIHQPVAIAPPGFSLIEGEEMTVSGWGSTVPLFDHYEGIDGQLRQTTVELIDHEVCNAQIASVAAISGIISSFSSVPPEIIKDLRICAAGDGTDTCGSDRGGPLLLSCPLSEEDLLIGVSSIGFGCAFDGIPRIYAALNIEEVLDFIEAIVEEQGHQLRVNLDVTSSDSFCNRNPNVTIAVLPTPFPTFNTKLWTCDPGLFGDLVQCNCDCGLPDPDCEYIEANPPCNSNSDDDSTADSLFGTLVGILGTFLLVGCFLALEKLNDKLNSLCGINVPVQTQVHDSEAIAVEDPIPVAQSFVENVDNIPVAQLVMDSNSKYDNSI